MSEAVDLERLMVQLEANSSKLEKDFKKADSVINSATDRWELRIAQNRKKIESEFGKMGSNAAKNFGNALLAGLSIAGITAFVSHITDITKTIEKQSTALGISTDTFQAWSLSAKKAGVDQEDLNTALDFFSKNLGLAQMKVTPFGTLLKRLGVDIHAGPEAALYQFVDAVNKVSNVQQRNALITTGMGRSATQMAVFLNQGSAALRAQAIEFKANGEIIAHEQIEKIHELEKAWIDLKAQLTVIGASVLSGFIDSFDKFVKDMGSQGFQSSLRNFGQIMGQVAGYMVKMGPYLPALAGAVAGARFGGPEGAVVGAIGGDIGASMASGRSLEQWKVFLDSALKRLALERSTDAAMAVARARQAIFALSNSGAHSYSTHILGSTGATGGGVDLSGALTKDTSAQKNLQAFNEWLTNFVQHNEEAERILKTWNKTLADSNAEVEEQIKLVGLYGAALYATQKQLELIQKFKDQHNQVAPEGSDLAAINATAAAYAREKVQLDAMTKTEQRSVDVQDDIRSGLEDIGAAGVTGFKSMADAAKQFIEQLAAMIIKLYIMKPLIESVLGQQGTSGGLGSIFGGGSGGIGSFLSTLPAMMGFANGGAFTVGGGGGTDSQFVGFRATPGERVSITPRAMSGARGGGGVVISIDARGAQAGVAEQIDAKMRALAPSLVAASVRASDAKFPDNMRTNMRDRF